MGNNRFAKQKALVTTLLKNEFEKAKELIVSGIDINAPYNSQGWTALHATIEHYAADAVVFLLRNHADPNRADATGMTPLHLSIDIEADSASQKPPILGIPVTPRLEITKHLLDYGAAPNAKNARGEPPLDWAERSGDTGAVDLLRRGAHP
jgi:ankyrin repeat protein